MSLFYLLAVIALWGKLTYWFWKLWRSVWEQSETKSKFITTPVFALIAIVWLSASFWYGGGRKFYYDAEVRRLCAIDGGVKVYETVTLPPEKFNEWGQPKFYDPTQGENTLGAEYVYKNETIYFRRDNPKLIKHHTRIFRKSDMRLLGEKTTYVRGGGDLPGPWMPSVYRCPSEKFRTDGGLFPKIFIKEKNHDDN